MTVAFDAATASGPTTSGFSFTHTPVGTPRGVIVLIGQAGGVTDEVTGVTYGGVSCTEFSESPAFYSATWGHYGYFLGSSIPTGAQTVVVSESASTTKSVIVITVTGADNTEIVNVDAYAGFFGDNLMASLALSGRTSFVATGFTGSDNSTGDIAPFSGWTQNYEHNIISSNVSYSHRYDTIAAADVDIYQGNTTQNLAGFAVAISEVVGGGAASFAFRRAFPRAILNF